MNKKVKQFFGSVKNQAAVAGAGVLALTAQVSQAAIDTTGITTAMTDAGAAIALVGAAYVIVKVGIKVFKWVAAAI